MKFCPECGKPLLEDALFCGHCGYRLPVLDEEKTQGDDSIEESEHNEELLQDEEVKTEKELAQDEAEETVQDELEDNEEIFQDEDEETLQDEFDDSSENNIKQGNKKWKKIVLIILAIALVAGLGVVGFHYLNKKSQSSSTSTTTLTSKGNKKIHITLKSVEPQYSVNGEYADIDLEKTKYKWETDDKSEEAQRIIDGIKNEYFKYSQTTNLKNKDTVTVSINMSGDNYVVTGTKTFNVKFNEEPSEVDDDDRSIEERVRDKQGYVFENSDTTYLTKEQLAEIKTKDQLRIAINEIYARHGFYFKRKPTIQKYFESKTWYVKKEWLDSDSQMNWSIYEDANLKALAKLRKGNLNYDPNEPLEY
jgi:uncharacterized Zn finger protein (UPF0148 family)